MEIMSDALIRRLEHEGKWDLAARECIRVQEYDELVRVLLGHREQVLSVVESSDIPCEECGLNFLASIRNQYLYAKETLDYYQLVQGQDQSPPSFYDAANVLFSQLAKNPVQLGAINQMNKPTFQLIPVFEHQGAGFERLVNAIDAHRLTNQARTDVWDELANRWGMSSEAPATIVGWKVAVIEGVKQLSPQHTCFQEGNGSVHRVEDQLNQWEDYYQQHGLHLCDKVAYVLLQMQEIRLAVPGTAIDQSGLDYDGGTYLKDATFEPHDFVPYGRWRMRRVQFTDFPPSDDERVGFRAYLALDMS